MSRIGELECAFETETATVQKQSSENARQAVSRKIPVRSIVQGSELDDGLSERALALRFKIDKSGISRWKTNPVKLADYTRDRDPDGLAWGFRDGKYYPLADPDKSRHSSRQKVRVC